MNDVGKTQKVAPIRYTDRALLHTQSLVLHTGDPETKRLEIRRYFQQTFDIDEALMEILADERAFYQRADPLRHPLIFYFGHTASFYINKLFLSKQIEQRINPRFESMFAVGVDEMSWDDLDEAHYDWPSLAEVQAYRDRVRERVDALIQQMPIQLPIDWNSPWWVIIMGIEHARIHLETSSVLIRQLPLEVLRSHPLWQACTDRAAAPENHLLPIQGGLVQQGKQRSHPLYGWDNEYGFCEQHVEDFEASQCLVSNGEYLAFVEDPGGYAYPEWWTDEGWRWRSYMQSSMPRFWRKENGEYRLRLLAEEVAMPWNWPVEVNYLEAKAFCNWKARQISRPVRLPSEAEWIHLRNQYISPEQQDGGDVQANINLRHAASSCPVDRFANGPFYDVIGNVWQWTESPISGFEGFEVHPYYDDFSTPTFDGQHNLIKGGSWISTGNEATADSRYAFRRHFYQHAGFRYIISDAPVESEPDIYESDPLVAMYCDMHYGEEHFSVANFQAELAKFCLSLGKGSGQSKALDIGCATGRSCFELARGFEQVTGLDFSARFIRIGVELKKKGRIRYTLKEEGDLESFREQRLEDLGLSSLVDKVDFFQADACNLKSIYAGYDLVLAANLIDRLYAPKKFLSDMAWRINPGGFLVLASPYSWDETFTEKKEWIGGYRVAGEPYYTIDGLKDILSESFTLIKDPLHIPFVIRETARKHQHTLSEVTAWQRKK